MAIQLNLRVSEREKVEWLAAAGGVPLSKWMRRVLNEAAEGRSFPSGTDRLTVTHLVSDEVHVLDPPVTVRAPVSAVNRPFRADPKDKAAMERGPKVGKAGGELCVHRVPVTAYCARCLTF